MDNQAWKIFHGIICSGIAFSNLKPPSQSHWFCPTSTTTQFPKMAALIVNHPGRRTSPITRYSNRRPNTIPRRKIIQHLKKSSHHVMLRDFSRVPKFIEKLRHRHCQSYLQSQTQNHQSNKQPTLKNWAQNLTSWRNFCLCHRRIKIRIAYLVMKSHSIMRFSGASKLDITQHVECNNSDDCFYKSRIRWRNNHRLSWGPIIRSGS